MAKRRDVEPQARSTGVDGRKREVWGYEDDAVCLARMKRDHAAAENIIARRKARNEFIAAHRKLAEVDPAFASCVFDGATLVEDPITMTPQQFFLALAQRYATNEQLAGFLYGRLTDENRKAKLTAIRVALNELSKLTDEEWAAMDTRARPYRMR